LCHQKRKGFRALILRDFKGMNFSDLERVSAGDDADFGTKWGGHKVVCPSKIIACSCGSEDYGAAKNMTGGLNRVDCIAKEYPFA
jgi:hypothetical protein